MPDSPAEGFRKPTPAEEARTQAETAKLLAEAAEAAAKAEVARINLDREEVKRQRELAADPYQDRTYKFLEAVSDASVGKAIAALNAWHREDPTSELTIIFDSPGGGVVEGFHLFDHILQLRQTHKIITVTRGYAASMAGILLQVGEERVMGPSAHLMLHEVSFGAHGKIGDVEDTVEFAKMLQERALDIFAERCKGASPETATKRLSKASIKRRWTRKNFWIPATDALAYGLVDSIR